MNMNRMLLGGAALGAMLAMGVAASADAKTMTHKHHHVAAVVAADDGKLSALTSEVETLESRLEAETQARQTLQGQVQAAQSQAAAAEADASAAHAQLAEQIQTIPGVVSSAVAANKPKPNWASDTTVTGRVYSDISNISQSPQPQKTNGTGFDIKRAYLGMDHKFNDVWSASLLVDFAPNGTILPGGTYGTGTLEGSEVLKNAFVQAKLDPALVLQVGTASMPWISVSEDTYGKRYVEKTLTDVNKSANSADSGAFAKGSFAGGIFNYAVAAVDGAGYKNSIRSNGMDFEGRVNINYMGFVAAIGGYTGKEANDIQAVPAGVYHNATREDVLVDYSNKMFNIGYEYFTADNWKHVTSTPDREDGNSVFGNFNFTPEWQAFGRYDWGRPSEKLASSQKTQYFNIGLQYEPVKVVDIALVYKHDALSGFKTGQASFGDANTTFSSNGHYDEVGIFTQFRF